MFITYKCDDLAQRNAEIVVSEFAESVSSRGYIDEEMYYDLVSDLNDKDGHQDVNRTWTNKIQYGYDDGFFLYRFTNSGLTNIYDYNCYIDTKTTVYKVDISSYDTVQQFDKFAQTASAIGSANWDRCLFTLSTVLCRRDICQRSVSNSGNGLTQFIL